MAGVSTALLGLVGCGGGPSTTAPRIAVVAGESSWGSVAAQIGGGLVHVTSIITDPNADPHSYESDPADSAAIAHATVVIENGLGYDDFLRKEIQGAGGQKQVIDVQALTAVAADANPHLWYGPGYVTATARAVEAQLAADDPAGAPQLRANLDAFLAAYQPYLDTIAAIRARYAGAAIGFTERVPGYLVEAAGLRLVTPAGFPRAIEDGTDPTPADTAAFNDDITGRRVKVLLYNAQVTNAQTTHLRDLATAAGVPVVGVAETLPSQYPTFQAWQIAQARALLAALGG